MTLLKNVGVSDSLFTLAAEGFTKVNPAAIAGANAPYGVLSGSIAALTGEKDYEVTAGDGTKTAVGVFLNNAEGQPYENSPAVASGKVTVLRGMASIEVEYFEDKTYKQGEKLYCSEDGFFTNEASANAQVLGVVTKVPTLASHTLGVQLFI